MNILVEHHQADLTWSLHLLAKRLGATLYIPYGVDWFDEGHYRIYEHPRKKDPARWLAKQYLEDVFYDFNGKTGVSLETVNGCLDYPHFNLLTFERAKEIQIDIVICSVHENEQYFAELKEFYPNAKFVRQVGNQLDTKIDEETYPNLLASAKRPYEQFTKHKVLYSQEFDLNLFKYRPVYNYNNIYSFQNDLEEDESAWDMWLGLRHALRDFNFKSFGVGNHDGKIFPKRTYIEKMLDSTFIFQRKFSEGFGHVAANAFCLGRIPVMNKETYLQGILAPLLEDEVTCLFIEDTFNKTADKIRSWSEPGGVEVLSKNAKKKFERYIDFDAEYKKVEHFFNNLI